MRTYAITNPVGTISLVGRVPIDLAYEGADEQFASDCALSGPRIAKLAAERRGVAVVVRVFHSFDEAIAAGRAIDVEVIPA